MGDEMTETGRREIGTGRLLALTGVLTVACAVLFLAFPQIDLAVSAHYLRDDGKFLLRGSWISDSIDMYVRPGLRFALIGLVLYALWRIFGPRRLRSYRPLVFIVLALGLGPGLLVNVVLKEHWGRARPVAVAEFGGDKTFSPALVIADQCDHNCSFVSGDVAVGFGMLAFALVARRRRTLWVSAAMAFGVAVSAQRVMNGSHFLSDAVFAALFTIATVLICYRWVMEGNAMRDWTAFRDRFRKRP